MPLWRIFHPEGTFTSTATKSALSKNITSIYTSFGLPAFYVVVLFIPLGVNNIYVGGEAQPSTASQPSDAPATAKGPFTAPSARPFIRLHISNIATKMPNDDKMKSGFLTSVDRALKPYIKDAGYDWEYHVDESNRDLWKIQGLVPPPFRSEAEKRWAEKGRPEPWTAS